MNERSFIVKFPSDGVAYPEVAVLISSVGEAASFPAERPLALYRLRRLHPMSSETPNAPSANALGSGTAVTVSRGRLAAVPKLLELNK